MSEAQIPFNLALFHWINAPAHPNLAASDFAISITQYSPFLALVLLGTIWALGRPGDRRSLLGAAAALVIGLAANFVIATVVYVPRPFTAGVGHTFLAHAPDSSFPSDHATFLWSLGFALIAAGTMRGIGAALAVLGAVTAWARIYLGLHFPFDMLGSLVVAFVATLLATRLDPLLAQYVLPRIEALQRRVIKAPCSPAKTKNRHHS